MTLTHPPSSTKAAQCRTWRSVLFIAPVLMLLAACSQESKPTPSPSARPGVSAVTLEPQPVAITAELPGRTSASVVAEVRPQVGGIIRSRNFKEGSDVKQGDVLYEIDPLFYQAAYDNANATLERARGALPTAKARFDRYVNLSKTNVISQQDLDDSQSTYAQAQADVAAAIAALETARINLDYTKIKAPVDGRIDASTVTVGALVTANQTAALATIRTLDPINVDVAQSSVNFLKLRHAVEEGRLKRNGNNVSVSLILEDGSTYKQPGTLEFAEATVAVSIGTINVRATFPNPDRLLLPGMYVRAIIEEGVAENSYLVPQRAVTRNTKGQATAKFVSAEGKVEDRILPVQRAIGNNWLVREGVKQGDRVIVEGSQRITPGQDVNVSVVTIDDATGVLRQASLANEKTSGEFAGADKNSFTAAVE